MIRLKQRTMPPAPARAGDSAAAEPTGSLVLDRQLQIPAAELAVVAEEAPAAGFAAAERFAASRRSRALGGTRRFRTA